MLISPDRRRDDTRLQVRLGWTEVASALRLSAELRMETEMLSSGVTSTSGAGRNDPRLRTAAAAPGVSHAIAGLQAMTASLYGLQAPDRLPVVARFALISQLEDDARDTIARVLAAPDRLPAHGLAGWPRFADEACAVFGALVDAYGGLVDLSDGQPDLRREVEIRLAGAAAQRLRWELQSCGPAHAGLWNWIGRSWLQDNPAGDCAREAMRALAYYSAGLDQLAPGALRAADSLIGLMLPHLELNRNDDVAGRYAFCPASDQAPRRMVRGEALSDGAYCLGTGAAYRILTGLATQLSHGVVPAGLGGEGADAAALSAALQVLLRQWSDAPPARRYRRHLLTGRLTAVRGFEEVRALLGGERQPAGSEWLMHDVSRGGIGAIVPEAGGQHVRMGDLVGLRAQEGEAWHLGVVRRKRLTDGGPFVGVETLSQQPAVVSADDGRAASEVLLCDPLLKGEAVRVLVPPDAQLGVGALFISLRGTIHKLKPLESSASGSDFELRVYQVL